MQWHIWHTIMPCYVLFTFGSAMVSTVIILREESAEQIFIKSIQMVIIFEE